MTKYNISDRLHKNMGIYSQFFVLLQAGLWGEKPYSEYFEQANADWQAIYYIASEHDVLEIIYKGLILLPPELQPHNTLLLKWQKLLDKIEQCNLQINAVLPEIYGLYKKFELSPVLLSGPGVALCYEAPIYRQYRNVDFYLKKGEYTKANEVLSKLGIPMQKKSLQQMQFVYKGISIRNHNNLFKLRYPAINLWLDKTANKWIGMYANDKQILDYGISSINPQFEILYTLIYAESCFLEKCLKLQQLCDWVKLLYKYVGSINLKQLEIDIDYLGIKHVWFVFGYIAVNYLGLDKVYIPFYDAKYSNIAMRVANYIFNESKHCSSCVNKGNLYDYYTRQNILKIIKKSYPLFPYEMERYKKTIS